MKELKIIRDEIMNGYIHYLRNVSIYNVIFGYHNKELKILLQLPYGINKWAVCGGYIKRTETIEKAAKRIARERTGLDNLYLKQFMAFGSPKRAKDSAVSIKLISELAGIKIGKDNWMIDYFVSLGFYTLTEFDMVKPMGEFYAEECQWWNILSLPPLKYDHQEIISEALKALRIHLYHYPIGYELLPEKFTLPEIHSLYETLLGKKLDGRNFSKKLLVTGIVKKLDEQRYIGAHRSPFLYIFDRLKYNNALIEGMILAI